MLTTSEPLKQAATMADVSTRSVAWRARQHERRLVRDVIGGTRRLRVAGELYLPRFPREMHSNHAMRLKTAVLTNVLKDAVENAIGRPFSQPVQLSAEAPAAVQGWAEDMTLQKHTLGQFARSAFRNAITNGMIHILVDYRGVEGARTRKDELDGGARPYFVPILADRLIACYRETKAGVPQVVHARIHECEVMRNGYAEETRERIRVIEPGRVELWEAIAGKGWQKIEEQAYPHDSVPLFTFYAGELEADYIIDPPFLDLAHKNIEHWQLSSGYRNNLDRCNFAMLAVKPMDGASSPVENLRRDPDSPDAEAAFEVGPDTVLVGDWYYVEPNAAGLKETAARLDALKADMRLMGLDPMMPKTTGGVTATERSIEEAKSQSQLADWVVNFSDVLDQALAFAMDWDGVKGKTKVSISSDFPLTLDAEDVDWLLKMRATGDLSRETVWDEAKRRGMLGPKFDAEKETARIEAEPPAFGDDGDAHDGYTD
jgi:hypothetical protein